MTWRDVPMPAQIARLPRDPRGYPIPYVAQQFGLRMPPRFDPAFGLIAEEDQRRPDLVLGRMGEERQRRCMFAKRCQVCEKELRHGARWMIGGVGDAPLAAFTFREPFVCGSCARYAMRVCPRLVTGCRSGVLRVVRARTCVYFMEYLVADRPDAAVVVPLVPSPSRDGGPGFVASRIPERSCALYVLARVTDGDVMMPSDFLDGRTAAGIR